MKVQKTIEKNCPDLALPHRRLVCYCRLYEVNDPNKKERQGKQRKVYHEFKYIVLKFKGILTFIAGKLVLTAHFDCDDRTF